MTTAGGGLSDLVAAARGAERAHQDAELTHWTAVGVGCDDPTNPGLAVVVHRGRIAGLHISDEYLTWPIEELNDVLNAAIINAFANWRTDAAH